MSFFFSLRFWIFIIRSFEHSLCMKLCHPESREQLLGLEDYILLLLVAEINLKV